MVTKSDVGNGFIMGAVLATVIFVTAICLALALSGCATTQIDAGCDSYCQAQLPRWGGYGRGMRTPDGQCHCEPIGVPL